MELLQRRENQFCCGCQKKSIYDTCKNKLKKRSQRDNTVKDIPGRENSVMMASCCSKKKG